MTSANPEPTELIANAGDTGAVNRAIVAGFGGKIAMTLFNLVVVAIAARALGPSGFGIISILTGLVTALGFLDLGIGNSAISSISASLSKGDHERAGRDVGVALVAMAAIGVTVASIGTVASLTIPRNWLFSTPGISTADLRLCLVVFAIALGIAIPGSLGSRICLAREIGAANNLYLVIGAAGSVLTTGGCALIDAPVWGYVITAVLVPNLVLLVQTVRYTTNSPNAVQPEWSGVSWRRLWAIGHSSFYFMVLGACSAVSFQTNSLVVAYVLDSRAAGILGVATRVYSVISAIFLGGLQQSWASSARAMANGQMTWVRDNFWRVLRVTGIPVAIISIVFTVIGRPLIELWAGRGSVPPLELLIALAAWTSYSFGMTQVSFLLNAANIVKPQAALAVMLLIVTVPLSVYLTNTLGLSGSTLAMLVTHIAIVGVPFVFLTRRVLTLPDGVSLNNTWSS